MYRHSKYGQLLFAPDKGGSSGGQPSGTTQPDGGEGEPNDPWAAIDWDNLDDASRKALETVKGQFATLQTTAAQKDELARRFQSDHDKTQAELERIKRGLHTVATGEQPNQNVPKGPSQEYIAGVEQTMIEQGVNPAAAKAQAPIMARLLSAQEEAIMRRVTSGVAPVANMVMNHQAEQAFNYARATDTTGALSIPDVAQAVWNSVQELSSSGTQVTAETVQNLKGMHFMAHAEKNPAVFATLQMNNIRGVPQVTQPMSGRPLPVSVTTGGFNYPGANFAPANSAPHDPNAPRTSLDAGTKQALQSIFSVMKPGHNVQ